MPTRDRVVEFIDAVIAEDHAKVLADYYHDDASIQENLGPPRTGRAALIDYETRATAQLQRMDTNPVKVFFVDGDDVAIQWSFVMTDGSGVQRSLVEMSLQKWHGDRISTEQFYYDSSTAWREIPADS